MNYAPADEIARAVARFKKNEESYRSLVGFVPDGAMLDRIRHQRKVGNPTHTVVCRDLTHHHNPVWHPIHSNGSADLLTAVADFKEKHNRCRPVEVSSVPVWSKNGWVSNADVKEAFQSEQTMTTTNLQSKASSATAGWTGATVDNTSNLYLDTDVHVVIAAVNTAPGSDKCIYVYAYAGTNSTDLTPTGAASGGAPGTEGSLTFPSVSTLPCVQPLLGIIPYPVQNAAIGGHFNLASVYGLLPAFWGVSALNFAGFTLASSGNTIKHRGLYNTVV